MQAQSPLTDLREKMGLTRAQWADMLGVTYPQVYMAENGRTPLPRKAQQALAELGIDADDLLQQQAAWIDDRARDLRAAVLQRGEVG